MALPKLSTPIYELTLPSNGAKISYRPFLVKEEKLLLLAAESQDEADIKRTILQVVRNCVLDEDFKPEQAPTFDVEYILIHLRIKSVGEEVKNSYSCNNTVNGGRCGGSFEIPIRLEELEIIRDDKSTNVIELAPGVSVKMKYPKFSDAKSKSDEAFAYELVISALDTLTMNSQTYPFKDQKKEEIVEFLDSLTKDQFTKLTEYFVKLPRFEINKEVPCPKCGFVHKILIEDLASFF